MDERLLIIGNGIAGITAARHVRKRSDRPITIVSSESKHFFSRTALMYLYMGHMKYKDIKPYEDFFWEKNRLDLIQDHVDSVNPQKKSVHLREKGIMHYHQLVIATGSRTATYGWEGLDLVGVQGLYSLQDLNLMEKNTNGIKNAVIVGGGLIGVEMAEMLNSRGIQSTMLIRESNYWGNVLPTEEAKLIESHLQDHGVILKLNTELEHLIDNGEGKVCGVKTSSAEEVSCDFVGITTGVKPNIEFLNDSGIESDKGVLVDEYLRTNQKDIFAIGDCAQLKTAPHGRKAIEPVWYVGKMMGEVAAANICGEATKYDPGPWFNSAKFFDIEYMTYGDVPASNSEATDSYYWESSAGNASLRLVYHVDGGYLTGLNALGVRLDHRQCDAWIRSKIPVGEVIEQLELADFNPEFFHIPFKQIKKSFKAQHQKRA